MQVEPNHSKNSYSALRETEYKAETYQKKKVKFIYIGKGMVEQKKNNICKYIFTKFWRTQFHKTNTTGHKMSDKPS